LTQFNWLTNMVDAAGTTKYTYTGRNYLLTDDGPFANDIESTPVGIAEQWAAMGYLADRAPGLCRTDGSHREA
jgi:hypothetical protein